VVVMFLTTAKEMWETLKVMYDNEKNPSRVFEIYERLFEFRQGDGSVPEFYDKLKGFIDELEMMGGIEISIWLEFYTTIPGAGSDTGRR